MQTLQNFGKNVLNEFIKHLTKKHAYNHVSDLSIYIQFVIDHMLSKKNNVIIFGHSNHTVG